MLLFFIFKCHHQKATIQIHLDVTAQRQPPSVKGWATWFLRFLPPWRLCDSKQTLSRNKNNTIDQNLPTAVSLGNLSVFAKMRYKKPRIRLRGYKRNTPNALKVPLDNRFIEMTEGLIWHLPLNWLTFLTGIFNFGWAHVRGFSNRTVNPRWLKTTVLFFMSYDTHTNHTYIFV